MAQIRQQGSIQTFMKSFCQKTKPMWSEWTDFVYLGVATGKLVAVNCGLKWNLEMLVLSMKGNRRTRKVRRRTDSNSNHIWLQLWDSNLGHTGERSVLSHTPSSDSQVGFFLWWTHIKFVFVIDIMSSGCRVNVMHWNGWHYHIPQHRRSQGPESLDMSFTLFRASHLPGAIKDSPLQSPSRCQSLWSDFRHILLSLAVFERAQNENILLVCTNLGDSVFRALWLATQTRDSNC